MWGMRTCVESRVRNIAETKTTVHIAETKTCLGNRPQEASDDLLDTRVETGADRGAEPDVQQATKAEDEAAARQRSSRSGRRREPTHTSTIQTSSLTPGPSHTTPWMTIGMISILIVGEIVSAPFLS